MQISYFLSLKIWKESLAYKLLNGICKILHYKTMLSSILKTLLSMRAFRISNLKNRLRSLYKKEKWQKKLHQGENKRSKRTKFFANIRWKLEDGKSSQTFFKIFEIWHIQISILGFTKDIRELSSLISLALLMQENTKHSCNPKDIVKSVKFI